MGQKYGGEPSGSSAQHLTISVDHSSSLTSSNKDLSNCSQLNKSDKYLKQMPSMVSILFPTQIMMLALYITH